jgi:hypothetical protein
VYLDGKAHATRAFRGKAVKLSKNEAWFSIEVPPGKYAVKVRIASGGGSVEESATVIGQFEPGRKRVLEADLGTLGQDLDLHWR